MTGADVTYRDHALGALLALAYLVLLLVTAPPIGMARDEGTYVHAANRYALWFRELAEDPSVALERATIDRYWDFNHEHPALVKSAFALSVIAQEELELFDQPSQAYRLPGMLCGAGLLWVVYLLGARTVGRQPGAIAALLLGLMPQVFHHAHLACFDVPITFMLTWVLYAYHRALERPLWAIPTGILYGLALATKHNAWILPFILLVHFVWMAVLELRRRRSGKPAAVRLLPYGLLAMLVLGPPIFVGTWPWLYHDTAARALDYARFHLQHEYYNMAYFGTNHYRPPFPVSYPFVMTAFTVPVTTLLLAGIGLLVRAPTYLPFPLTRLVPERLRRRGADPRATDVLFVGCLLAPIVAVAHPSTPIFGGPKHWFPAYPFLALFAGLGARRAIRFARGLTVEALPQSGRLVRAALASLLVLPSFVETESAREFGLGHYTFGAGFTQGAADYGMNRQFWGYTTGSLAGYFRTHLPDGGSVWICDTVPMAFEMLQRDGALPTNIRVAWTIADADYAIVHHEHHFAEVDGQIWVAYGTTKPEYVLTHHGVPFVSVYRNPRRPPR